MSVVIFGRHKSNIQLFMSHAITYLIKIMEEDKRLKMAVISGAAHAMQYKEKNPRSTEDQVIQHVTKEVEKILEKIDEEL